MVEETIDSIPSEPPTMPPECDSDDYVDVTLTCVTEVGEKDCSELEGEDQLQCTCEECVHEVRFRYTASTCDEGFESCVDQPGPDATSTLIAFKSDDLNDILFTDTVSVGDDVVVSRADGSCLPDSIGIQVVSSSAGETVVTQSSVIDSSCDGAGLSLKESYGALDFTGYSCKNETDAHNCFTDVTYNIAGCHAGPEDLTLDVTGFNFTMNKNSTNLIEGVENEDSLQLNEGECYSETVTVEVDLCSDGEYCAESELSAQATSGGAVCDSEAEDKFSIVVPTPPPTPSPSDPPTAAPTLPPTPSPTTPTTQPPITCEFELGLDVDTFCNTDPFDVCKERPFRMNFFYAGGTCQDTKFAKCVEEAGECDCPSPPEEDWADNKISCEDFTYADGAGPPAFLDRDVTVWIQAKVSGKDEMYFEGNVTVGEFFEALDPELEKVEANMDIHVFEYVDNGPGRILQEIIFHSSCSQELYVGDQFGGVQLIAFEYNDDCGGTRVVDSLRRGNFVFDLDLTLDVGGSLVLDFAQIFLTSASIDVPQVANFNVTGQSIPPALELPTEFNILRDTNYTATAIVTGSVNGVTCTGSSQLEFRCNRVCEEPPDDECPDDRRLGALRGGFLGY